jgi:tRNA-dihydrouridine synthase
MRAGCTVSESEPPRASCTAGAVQAADGHLRALLAWDSHASELGTLRSFRKLVPLYLHGFASATQLRRALLTADSVAEWQAAIAAGAPA